MRRPRISSMFAAWFAVLISISASRPSMGADLHGRLTSSFRDLQLLDWRVVDEKTASSVLQKKLETDTPDLAESCQGTILYAAALSEGRIIMEFDQEIVRNHCFRRLTHATAVLHVSNNEAHILETEIRRAVKAGGRPCASGGADEYEWRSRDSLTRYTLHTEISADSATISPTSPARLRIGLEHFAVSPADVDDLPFERGFRPSCS
jgi:hypothetical protein